MSFKELVEQTATGLGALSLTLLAGLAAEGTLPALAWSAGWVLVGARIFGASTVPLNVCRLGYFLGGGAVLLSLNPLPVLALLTGFSSGVLSWWALTLVEEE
jgi:hypothetical protein